MSAIASFRIFDVSALEELINKPTPDLPKAGIFRSLFGPKQPSPEKFFMDEYDSLGKQVEPFEHSGYAFPSLEAFLQQRFGINISDYQNDDLSRLLEERIGQSQAFDSSGAQNLLAQLSTIGISRDDLEKFADEEYGEDHGAMVEALEGAFNLLPVWLAQVGDGQIGVLTVG